MPDNKLAPHDMGRAGSLIKELKGRRAHGELPEGGGGGGGEEEMEEEGEDIKEEEGMLNGKGEREESEEEKEVEEEEEIKLKATPKSVLKKTELPEENGRRVDYSKDNHVFWGMEKVEEEEEKEKQEGGGEEEEKFQVKRRNKKREEGKRRRLSKKRKEEEGEEKEKEGVRRESQKKEGKMVVEKEERNGEQPVPLTENGMRVRKKTEEKVTRTGRHSGGVRGSGEGDEDQKRRAEESGTGDPVLPEYKDEEELFPVLRRQHEGPDAPRTSLFTRPAGDTDDSDVEGALGNVTRMIMRPAGHSGKAKRGHLCFDASFETGNLGRVDLIADYEYDLFVRPDTCNPRFRFWFHFAVDNAKADQRAIFNVVNFHKHRNLFCEGLTPLVRSTSRPQWSRVPTENVYYYRSPDHMHRYLLSFAVCFDREEDVYHFALTYPYSYARLQEYLNHVDGRGLTCWRRNTLALSVQKRKCDVITITSPRNFRLDLAPPPGGPAAPSAGAATSSPVHREESTQGAKADDGSGSEAADAGVETTPTTSPSPPHAGGAAGGGTPSSGRRSVVILARSHGGESPASYIVQGVLDTLRGDSQMASTLRDHVVFKIVPMLNPDGVYLGNYRCSLMGFDLNRCWNNPSPWGHPTIHAARSLVTSLDHHKGLDLDLVLDLHAHSSLLGTFVYGNAYEDVYRHERHIVFPKMLNHSSEDFSQQNTIYNRDPAKSYTARRWLCNNVKDSVNVYSVHTSVHGYVTSSGRIQPYCAQTYARVGRCLVRAILDYFLFLGIIPQDIPLPVGPHDLAITKDQLQPKPGRVQPCFLQVRAEAEARERAHRRLRAKTLKKVDQCDQEDTDEDVEEEEEEQEDEEKAPWLQHSLSGISGESREEEEEEEEVEEENFGGARRRRRRRLKRRTGEELKGTEEGHSEEGRRRRRWRERGGAGGTSTSREGSSCGSSSRSSSSNTSHADVLSPDGDNSDASGILVRITRHRHEEEEEEEKEEEGKVVERGLEGLRRHQSRHLAEVGHISSRKNPKEAAALLLLLPPQGLHGQGRGASHLFLPPGGGGGVTSRHPKTTLMQLYPDEGIPSSPPPGVEEEEAPRSLPDLPSLTTSLPILSDKKKGFLGGQQNPPPTPSSSSSYRRRKRSSPSKSVAWKDMEEHLEPEPHFKYYDFRRITGSKRKKRKRRRKKRKGSKSRSPSSRRRPKAPLSSSPPPPAMTSSTSTWSRPRGRSRRRRPPPSSSSATPSSRGSSVPFPRNQATRLVAGGGFYVSRMAAAAASSRPSEGGEVPLPPASSSSSSRLPVRGLRTIDVSRLTIGGFLREEGEHYPSTTSSTVRRSGAEGGSSALPRPSSRTPSSPPAMIRRFFDPKATLL